METSPPNVTLRRNILGLRLATTWNVLIEWLAMVQLSQGTDVFRWNLHENVKFSVNSIYRALVHQDVLVGNNNKKFQKMKIPLKIKTS